MSDSRASSLRALLFVSSAAGMLVTAPALAAEVTAEDGVVVTADQQEQQPANLGTIDVHGQAQRREPESPKYAAPLVDTPRAVTIIPEQIIQQTAATSLQDLLRNSPGITFGAGEGGQPLADRPFIRGQSSGNNIFVDGIRDTGGQQREVFNLEQVEVIKGADSVYSGRGSGGGSINLSSKSPKLTDFTAVSAAAGTDAYLRGTVDTNIVLNENSALRVNLMAAQGDVPGRDVVDYDKWGVAVSIAAGLGTDTTVTGSYYHLDSDQMPDYGIPLASKVGGFGPNFPNGISDVPTDSFYGVTARDFLTNKVDSVTLDVQHRFSDALTIRNVTRYAQTLNDYIVTNPGDGTTALIDGVWWMRRGTKSRWNPTETTANVTDIFGKIEQGGITHNYDVGLELSREINRNASYVITNLSGTACPGSLAGTGATPLVDCTPVYDPNPSDPWTGSITRGAETYSNTNTLGVYAFDSINIGERWVLNLGVRYDSYDVDGITLGRGATVPTVDEGDWDFVNYQVGLVYKPTENTSVYASYATSSTPPTLSGGDQNASGGGTDADGELLDPEDTENMEVGAKAMLFGERLSVSGTVFQTTRKNAQIEVESGVFEQAGETKVKGLELSVSGNITPAWTVFGGYTYMDSELVRGAYSNTKVGDPLNQTPKNSVSLFTTYRVLPKMTLGGGVYYVDKVFGGNQGGAGGGNNAVFLPDYTRLDLFGSYEITDRVSVQLNVQNATDEAYFLRTNGSHHADPAPERQAILTLNARF